MSTRRSFIGTTTAGLLLPAGLRAQESTPLPELLPELVIDITGPPDNLTPALSYSTRDWSIIHSVYDSLLDFGPDGAILPQAAEMFETDDAITFRFRLRPGMTFHDGTPVTVAAVARGVTHMKETQSQVSELFGKIDSFNEIDDLNGELVCSEPSAWLPSQIAVWGVLLPESFTEESLSTAPIGSGPYVFEEWVADSHISLSRNPDYPANTPKGNAMAERVVYRFVPEATTRVADLTSGQAQIVADLPQDQLSTVEGSGNVTQVDPILGMAFIRIANDTPPFDDPRIARALNLGVDVDAIAETLVSPEAHRLASVFPDERGLGFDIELQPFPYDPDQAHALLAEAGFADGIDAEIQVVANSRLDVVEAIVAQLAEIGVRLTIVSTELAQFNQDWPNSQAAALRFATWRPMYDPFTFLRLVVDSDGFLGRYSNPGADELIRSAAVEPDPERRAELYHELGRELQETPCAIYLWNLVSASGVSADIDGWEQRGDEYVLPLERGN